MILKKVENYSFITIYPFLTLVKIAPLIILMGGNLDRDNFDGEKIWTALEMDEEGCYDIFLIRDY